MDLHLTLEQAELLRLRSSVSGGEEPGEVRSKQAGKIDRRQTPQPGPRLEIFLRVGQELEEASKHVGRYISNGLTVVKAAEHSFLPTRSPQGNGSQKSPGKTSWRAESLLGHGRAGPRMAPLTAPGAALVRERRRGAREVRGLPW